MNLQTKVMIYFVFVIVVSGIILAVTEEPAIKIATIFFIVLLGVLVPRNILNTLNQTNKKIGELEQKINESNKKLMQLDQMGSSFISLIGHELRTPLSSIKESIALILDESTGKINPQQHRMLSIAENNIARLNRLVNDVLDLSKIEAGKLGVRRIRLDLTRLLKEIAREMSLSARNKKISVETEIPPDLPEAYADSDRITQVVSNLINNAVKYTPEGGKITVKAKKADDRFLEISVQDTGMGIKSADYDKVFAKFQQMDYQMNRRNEGVGLGLAISKGLVEAHGGRMWFESEFRKGSIFIFSLPLYKQKLNFDEYLEEELKNVQKEKGLLSLIILKIGNYKEVKDMTLNKLEELIRQMVFGSHDIAMPYKDIGFAVLARTDIKGASSIAERIKRNIIEQKFPGDKIKLTVTAGIATYPIDAGEKNKLVKKAESALFANNLS
jgi:diguanylate cyclase (GGDEF)-like protein